MRPTGVPRIADYKSTISPLGLKAAEQTRTSWWSSAGTTTRLLSTNVDSKSSFARADDAFDSSNRDADHRSRPRSPSLRHIYSRKPILTPLSPTWIQATPRAAQVHL